ncbi:MAG: carboxy terminal-processing peptidase [Bacteroidia bacterium]|nr:carboxy terminal-processing peptidase [Bacteroidia bacterium]
MTMRITSVLTLITLFTTLSIANGFASRDTLELKSKQVYGKEAKVISYILDNNHYRKLRLNDSLSSAILDKYIKELDNNRSYFIASDLKDFEKFRFSIDDLTRNENVEPAYEIYRVFRKRYSERMDFVMNNLIHQEFDYSIDEYYETDRDKEAWATNIAELNDIWRKIIKNQSLGLKLTGKTQEEIEDVLKKRYQRFIKSVSQFTGEDVFGVYMNAITESYDPHTNYLSPKASALFTQSMSLSLEGIGAQLQTENDYTKIVRIMPGGPAEKSDLIHSNDLIIGVAQGLEGEMVDVIGWRIDEVVKLIKGPKGTTVRLSFLPSQTGVNGSSKEIKLVREKIKLEDQEAKRSTINYQSNGRNLKLGVINLPNFYMDFEEYQKGNVEYKSTTRDVKRLITELQAEGVDGIVMDLRNNGGGSLAEAIDLTGLFIKDGPVVQVRNSAGKVDVGYDDDNKVVYSGPLLVLTNRFSASASEIFAGAIQDYKRGVIVGESTFGKGTVQQVLPLKRFIVDTEEVGDLKLTFQKFYRVTGSSTQHKGVSPDIKLPSALGESQYGESANPSALPWDVIKPTPYKKVSNVGDSILSALSKSYLERSKFDTSLKQYVAETEELKKNLAQTKISLNETVRKHEMEQAERNKSANGKLDTKITSKEGVLVDELLKLNDEYLREGLLILADLVTRRIG